jgi:anaerobic selenocysteine-containing dehydrogenase
MRRRLRALRDRGGKLIVIDPRRTRTAEIADEHHFIRPGTDALLLLAMIQTIFAEDLARPGALAEMANGIEDLAALAAPFTPEAVSGLCGIDAVTIRKLARDLAAARVQRSTHASAPAQAPAPRPLARRCAELPDRQSAEGGAMF